MSRFRPEFHVAQQSRRDKLRVPQGSNALHHLEDFPDNLEQLPDNLRLNPDLVNVRNVNNASLLYDPAVYSQEMSNFSMKSNVLLEQRDAMVHQGIDATQIGRPINVAEDHVPFANSSHTISFNPLPKAGTLEPQNCGYWKSLGSQQSSCTDWMMNTYASDSVGSESNTPSPMFYGEVSNISAYPQYMKHSYNAFQNFSSSKNPCSKISSQDRHKHSTSAALNQSSLLDTFTSSIRTQEMASSVQQNIRGTARGAWAEGGNELALLPAYGNQSDVICFDNSGAWTNRSVENCHHWSGQLGLNVETSDGELRNVVSTDSNPQGLSLSLSSNPSSKIPVARFGEGCVPEDLDSRTTVLEDPRDSKTVKSGYLCSVSKPSMSSTGCGRSLQDMVGGISTNTYQNTGPLGPFTGYATILKSSKFLEPAQQLLDELCGITGSKHGKTFELSGRTSGEVSPSGDALNATETEVGARANNSGGSSSTFYASNDISGDGRGVGTSTCESFRPEYRQRKAKLVYMQEEICRRFKQYHQQMQMVVSSFESVAGLGSATPYISFALKSILRHFRCIKNAITDQLKHIRKGMGENLSSPSTGTSNSKGDASTLKLKYLNPSLQMHKYGGGNLGFLETQHHVWRPQRGLPERSVAILRAWLFEHFLHPYPTDTDKHMLATQTGLSRNQVSNWFINARVRVWKPMVEEIHMLETKGMAESNQIPSKNDESSAAAAAEGTGSFLRAGHGLSAEQWNQEKRSKMECPIPTTMDGTLMGFVPYQQNGVEIGGVGAVSLTLGLRHDAENAQHRQQQQQQEDQQQLLRREFGGGMIHDFVG
ncbi:uncharacterized protein LOC108990328 isoform X2 [Juglans regia]|uniref:Uncharacterized protein LOC108990328 isoform X2 n=1 Tax=Juglans regia TaxID=51240 RepID=A0A6P9E1J1_JUGRE|nr:uncharacterized protein LOC108990328 isoform X2 [Juglans regia]